MHLLLTAQTVKLLRRELRRAGRQEIGGVLMGEHVRDETFRIVDITVQREGGSATHFVRQPAQHQRQLEEFFARTGRDYVRFNYLGEWHSHPSFEPLPSQVDLRTMQEMVEDASLGANFLVLIIIALSRQQHIEASAMLVRPHLLPSPISIAMEDDGEARGDGFFTVFFRRLLGR